MYVPAKDHPAGSMRKVYPSAIAWDDYPDYNCTSNPRPVAPLPEAYGKTDRNKYDPAKAWWISGQVTMLTRGYYSVYSPEVRAAAANEEQRAAKLVEASSSQSAEAFAQTLRENAERTLEAWKTLYGNLLVSSDADHRIDYDKMQSGRLKVDKVKKY